MKILLLDDDRACLEDLGNFLKKQGFSVQQFIDPKTAIKAHRSEKSDVVITDIKMPQMNGIEVLKVIRKQEPETSVIIITAFDDAENRQAALEEGAYAFFPKPLNLKQLLSTLARIEKEANGCKVQNS